MSLISEEAYLTYRIRTCAINTLREDPFSSRFLAPFATPTAQQCRESVYLSVLYGQPMGEPGGALAEEGTLARHEGAAAGTAPMPPPPDPAPFPSRKDEQVLVPVRTASAAPSSRVAPSRSSVGASTSAPSPHPSTVAASPYLDHPMSATRRGVEPPEDGPSTTAAHGWGVGGVGSRLGRHGSTHPSSSGTDSSSHPDAPRSSPVSGTLGHGSSGSGEPHREYNYPEDVLVTNLLTLHSKSFHSAGAASASLKRGLLLQAHVSTALLSQAPSAVSAVPTGSRRDVDGGSSPPGSAAGAGMAAAGARRSVEPSSPVALEPLPPPLAVRDEAAVSPRSGPPSAQSPAYHLDRTAIISPDSYSYSTSLGLLESYAASLVLDGKGQPRRERTPTGSVRRPAVPVSEQYRRRANSTKVPAAPAMDIVFEKRAFVPMSVGPRERQLGSTPQPTHTHQPFGRSGLSLLFGRSELDVIDGADGAGAIGSPHPASASLANPFTITYAKLRGLPGANPIRLRIYVPSIGGKVTTAASEPLQLDLHRSASVEEAIGYALYVYCAEGRYPRLPLELVPVALWSLRIAEDDGTIDDDFPELERTRKIEKYSFDAFALCHQRVQIKSMLRALVGTDGVGTGVGRPGSGPAGEPLTTGPRLTSAMALAPGSKGTRPSTGPTGVTATEGSPPVEPDGAGSGDSAPKPAVPTVFLKLHLYSTLEVKQTTTLPFPVTMALADVFHSICLKRKYDPKDYVLKMPDTRTDAPLDRTLEELRITEFCVLKRSQRGAGDIFLRPPEESDTRAEEMQDFLFQPAEEGVSVYKQFAVTQRLFMGRKLERLLTIDGDSVYLWEPEHKTLLDALHHKTLAFPISTLLSCVQVKKSAHFKLTVSKQFDAKTLDLEAASGYAALEICTRITHLIQVAMQANPAPQ